MFRGCNVHPKQIKGLKNADRACYFENDLLDKFTKMKKGWVADFQFYVLHIAVNKQDC